MLASNEPGPINLGNPVELTVRETAELVLELIGSRSQIQLCPLPKDDVRRRRPDISLARAQLGWNPRVPLQEGLARTIEWHASKLSSPNCL
jgi:dTDP-glucose 4,6-dehydratase